MNINSEKIQKIKIKLSPKWKEIIKNGPHGLDFDTPKKWLGVWGGRSGQKSHTVATVLKDIGQARPTRIICLREIQSSIKDSVYSLMEGKVLNEGDGKWEPKRTAGEITHKNGSYITFWGMRGGSKQEEKTRAKSIEGFDIAWIEEAQACTEYTIELFFPSIRKKGSKIIATWNTDLPVDPIRKKIESSDFGQLLNVNYTDNLMLGDEAKAEAEEMARKEPELYRHIYLGEPRNQSGSAILARSRVYDAYTREIKGEGGISVGADIARFGDDKIIFYARKGLKITGQAEHKKLSIIETARRLIDFVIKHGGELPKSVPVKIDDTGLGGGVTDFLKDQGYNALPVNFGDKPKDPDKYADTISEMWFEFEGIIDEARLIEDRELTDDLTGREYTYTSKEQKKVERKEDFKKRYGRSPDKGDALLLCFYNPNFQIPDMSAESVITTRGGVAVHS